MNKEKMYLYVLTNPFYPRNCIKVGNTDNPHRRLKELSSSPGVPQPFKLYCTLEVPIGDERIIDKYIHDLFRKLNPTAYLGREFFNIYPEDAYDIFVDIAKIAKLGDCVKKYDEDKLDCFFSATTESYRLFRKLLNLIHDMIDYRVDTRVIGEYVEIFRNPYPLCRVRSIEDGLLEIKLNVYWDNINRILAWNDKSNPTKVYRTKDEHETRLWFGGCAFIINSEMDLQYAEYILKDVYDSLYQKYYDIDIDEVFMKTVGANVRR